MRNKQKTINLYKDYTIDNMRTVISIGSEEDLNQCWEFFINLEDLNRDNICNFINILFDHVLQEIKINKDFFTDIIIEKSKSNIYLTFWNKKTIHNITKILKKQSIDYKDNKKRLTLKFNTSLQREVTSIASIFPINAVSATQKNEVQKVLEKSKFNENEELLRRTHVYKISASDYMATLSDTIEDDLEEISELQLDLQSELYEFEYSQKYETLKIMSGIFKSYARTLIGLIEFSDLGDAAGSVASYLNELTQEHIKLNGFMIKEAIQSIHDDLANWHKIVFITQQTNNIHYLDSSLYNTIIELKNVFEIKDNNQKDELEFF